MHLCSLCCAPRCCARNGWTESHDHFPDSANAPAILPNESYNFNNSLSRIPNSKKKSFLFSHLFVFQFAKKFTKSKSSVHFVQIQWSSFDQRNLDRRGDLFHRPWTTSRPRRGSFSSFSHPARGYDALRILEGRGRSSSATEEKKGRGEIAIGRRRTGHDIVDESRRSSSSSRLDRLVMSLNISVFEEHELPQMTSTHPRPRRLLLLLLHETFYLSRSPPPPPRVSLGIQGQVGSLQLARGSWRIRDSSFEEIYGAAWSW